MPLRLETQVTGKHGLMISPSRSSRFRPEIAALRAVAVMLVVTFHFWPKLLPGGFVGVDVFFAISGFLIGGHLLRELTETGAIRLKRFWMRRISRLLPASLTVLAAITALTWVLVPAYQWRDSLNQLVGSALYVQNWVLTTQAVDYLAQDNAPTAVQHYWSLSVEEQFYIFVPIILTLVWWLSRGSSSQRKRFIAVAGVLIGLGGVSFILSISLSGLSDGSAYFSTAVRAWEFLGGVMLAFALRSAVGARIARGAQRAKWTAPLGWVLVCAGVVLSVSGPFPGYLAVLPVGGALLVILAGTPADGPRRRAYSFSPVLWTGDVSYSLYLWHWPVILLLPRAMPALPSAAMPFVALVMSFALAWVTRRLIEQRYWWPEQKTVRIKQALTTSAMLTVLVIAGSGVQLQVLDFRLVQQRADLNQTEQYEPECFGAAASSNPNCSVADQVSATYPIELALADSGPVWDKTERQGKCDDWLAPLISSREYRCTLGTSRTGNYIALVGDSHSAQWASAIQQIARDSGMGLLVFSRGGCPAIDMSLLPESAASGRLGGDCASWAQSTIDEIHDNPNISMVVSSMWSYSYLKDTGSSSSDDAKVELAAAYASALSTWTDSGKSVVVLRDTPFPRLDIPACLANNPDADACAYTNSDKYIDTVSKSAVELMPDHKQVQYIDLSAAFCAVDHCSPVIGGVIVFRDHSHITATFASSLLPQLRSQIYGPQLAADFRAFR